MLADRSILPFTSIICISASTTDKQYNSSYVQGAGDDEEGWAQNLTAELFWKHQEYILGEGPADIEERVASVVRAQIPSDDYVVLATAPPQESDMSQLRQQVQSVGNTRIFLCDTLAGVNWGSVFEFCGGFINCSSMKYRRDGEDMTSCGEKYLHVIVPSTHTHAAYGKRPAGRSVMLQALQRAVPFVHEYITSSYP